MTKRITIVLTALPHGGGKFQYSLSMLDAVSSLPKDRFRLSVIYFNDEWRKYIPAEGCIIYKCDRGRLANGIKKVLLWLSPGLSVWRRINIYVHPLHRLLHQISPHLVIYPGNDSYVYESSLPGVAPIFDLMHRYEPTFPEVSANGLRELRDDHYNKICIHAKAILVDSLIGKMQVAESYNADLGKIFILPFIAPSYIFKYKGDLDVIEKYGLPERYIFYPAQLWKHKNHVGLLKAMSILKKDGLIVNLVITGSCENGAEEIFDLIRKLELSDHISYLSYVNDEEIVSLYRNSVALVMPTFFGPTNIPPLEAFALGCPVATSNIYGIQEQVGDAALLFDPHDFQDIARKVSVIWGNEDIRRTLVLKGYNILAEWNHKTFNERVRLILDDIIG